MANEKKYPIPIKELAKKVICDGHLFLTSKEGRKFYVMKPGIFLDQSFIKKHALTNSVFDMEQVTSDGVRQKFSTLFKELRYLQFEKDLRAKSREIIEFFLEVYSGDEHFLSFALACQESFLNLPAETLTQMHETDMYLFRKAVYSGAFAIIIAVSNDFYNFMMLKDFYNLSFGLDLGLCHPNYSYFVAQACNQENKQPGSGLEWLVNQNASELEIQVFLEHPRKTYTFFKSGPDTLAHPELAEITLYQHELSDGKGFPRGIRKGQVSSWEAVVMLADGMVEISDTFDFETRVVEYMKTFTNQKLSDLPVERVYNKMADAFGKLSKLKETGT